MRMLFLFTFTPEVDVTRLHETGYTEGWRREGWVRAIAQKRLRTGWVGVNPCL